MIMTHIVLAKDLILLPNSHIWQLTNASKSSSRESIAFFWTPWGLHLGAHEYTLHICNILKQINFSLEIFYFLFLTTVLFFSFSTHSVE